MAVEGDTFAFQAGPETLPAPTWANFEAGQPGESGAGAGGRRRGWADISSAGTSTATGNLLERRDHGDWSTFWFSVPRTLARQMASKGSIAVDGVSLTIVDSEPDRFSVALIPYTLAVTRSAR